MLYKTLTFKVHTPVNQHRSIATKGSGSKKVSRKSKGNRTSAILEPRKPLSILPRDKEQPLTDLATPPAKVSAFCQIVLSRILPNEFFGDGSTGQQNKDLMLKKVHQFILLRRFEGIPLHEVMQGMKVQSTILLRR